MPSRADDLNQTPLSHAQVTIPTDATDGLVNLLPLGPDNGACKAIRWLGSGAAVLWYVPATPRLAYTTTEQAVPTPNERGAIPASYKVEGEERQIQAVAIDTDSANGIWEVTF